MSRFMKLLDFCTTCISKDFVVDVLVFGSILTLSNAFNIYHESSYLANVCIIFGWVPQCEEVPQFPERHGIKWICIQMSCKRLHVFLARVRALFHVAYVLHNIYTFSGNSFVHTICRPIRFWSGTDIKWILLYDFQSFCTKISGYISINFVN